MPSTHTFGQLAAILSALLGTATLASAQCPDAPASISISGGSTACATSATVLWSAVSGVTGYDVARGTSTNSASATVIASLPSSAGSFLDTMPPLNQTVYYFVRSKDSPGIGCVSGIGPWSAPIPSSRYTPITAAPGSPTVSGTTCSSITLSWPAVAGAQNYQVLVGQTSSFSSATLLGTVSSTSSAFAPSDVAGKFVWIRPANICGVGTSAASAFIPTSNGVTITGLTFAAPTCDRVQASITGSAPGLLVAFTWMNPPAGIPAPIGTVPLSGPTASSSPLAGATPGQSVTVRADITDPACPGVTHRFLATGTVGGAASATVPGTIAITGQPISIVGSTNPPSPTFVTYSWLKDGLPLSSDGGRITGLTTPTLSFSSTKVEDVGSYTLVVNNTCTLGSSVSGAGVLGVRVPCRADFDQSGVLALADIFEFLNAWFAGCP